MSQFTDAIEQARQYRELAATIADQAQAIADGTLTGPKFGAVSLLLSNTKMLMAWTPDDRARKETTTPAREGEK